MKREQRNVHHLLSDATDRGYIDAIRLQGAQNGLFTWHFGGQPFSKFVQPLL